MTPASACFPFVGFPVCIVRMLSDGWTPDFRALFERSPALCLALNPDAPDYTVVAVSNDYAAAVKSKRDEIVGRRVFDLFHEQPGPSGPGDRDLRASLDAVLRTKTRQVLTGRKYLFPRPAEEGGGFDEHWWSAINEPVLGAEGQVLSIIHRAEEAGLENLQLDQLRAFVRYAPMSIAMFDREMNYLATSEHWRLEFARSYRELTGLNHYKVHPDLPTWWKGVHQRGLAGETIQNTAEVWLQADGNEYWSSWTVSPWRDEAGRIGGIVIATENITERKRAEDALRASGELMRAVLEGTADAVFVKDVEGRHVLFNEAAGRFVGKRPEEVLGRDDTFLFSPEDVKAIKERERAVLAGGKTITYEDEVTTVDGERRTFSVSQGPVHDATGKVTGVFGIARDLTERKRVEEALRDANVRLKEGDERKDSFISMLSHELRNPLSPLQSGVEILERAPPGGELARRAQAIIGRQVAHLTHLIEDLLDVTRIARGKVSLVRERLDLNEVAERIVEDRRPEFTKAGVELIFERAPTRVWVDGDRTRLAQVVGNLLQNAAKFTPGGGRTTVSISRVPADPNATAVLRVRDTGRGLEPGLLSRVFDPFTQADSSLDRSKGGLGLGLAVAKGLVDLHGGAIRAESDGTGRGTTITINLPLDTSVSTAAAERGVSEATTGRRILVIDDNRDAAETLRDLLELEGHETEIAYDGPEGLAKVRTFRPDAVLCDIGLPEMDGFEVARRLRADPELEQLVLVAVSGYARPEDVARGKEAGFDAHVSKPPTLEVLIRELDRAIQARKGGPG